MAKLSPQNLDRPALSQPRALVPGFVTLLTATVLYVIASRIIESGQPASTAIQFHIAAIPAIFAFAANLVGIIFLFSTRRPTATLQWLALLLLSLTIWSGAEAMLRMSSSSAAATFWGISTILGSSLTPAALYLFALTFTGSRQARSPILLVSLIGLSSVITYAAMRTELIRHYSSAEHINTAWGYVIQTGPLYGYYSGWVALVSLAAIAQLIEFYRRSTDKVVRRQTLLVIIGVSIPVGIGSITDVLLPTLNIISLPAFSPVFSAAMGAIITYTTLRYRDTGFSPSVIAEQILDTMQEAVVGVGPDLRISYVNAGAEKLFGLNSNSLTGNPLTSYLSGRKAISGVQQALKETMAGTANTNIDTVELKGGDGKVVTAKVSVTRMPGGFEGDKYLMVMTDITEIAQATLIIERQVAAQTAAVRQAKAQLDSSINSLELGFIITDDRPQVVMLNQHAHNLLCGDKSHIPDACAVVTLSSIVAKVPAGDRILSAINKCLKGRHSQTLKSIEINQRSWRIFVSPVVEGSRATGTAILLQDITEELILARSRDEFFSIASHELRTPLTAIKGSTSMMLQYYPEAFIEPDLKEMIEDINESSNRLIAIVNDFLDASRLEQGRISYNFQPVSAASIAHEVIHELTSSSQQKHISLKIGEGLTGSASSVMVRADASRLKQILYNLVGNALKFTDKGSIILDGAAQGRQLSLSVTDTGHGIDAHLQPILFHKFQQASQDPLTRDAVRGTGLGLYISRLLARGMGGDLILEKSTSGSGSTFIVTIPIESQKAEAKSSKKS